jgi:hypothetical protein
MLNKRQSSIQTFKVNKSLINETPQPEFSKINDWFFEEFHKTSITKFGFMSVIRNFDDETIYLKLYYVSEIIRDSLREIEDFVCAFYAHEKFEFKYTRCNILKIPLKQKIEEKSIDKLTNIHDLELLLQTQIEDDSWVGVDHLGTQGAYINDNPNKPKLIYYKWKQLLFEGFLEPEYEYILQNEPKFPRITNSAPKITELQLDNGNFELKIGADCFSISWKQEQNKHSRFSFKFRWRGVLVNFTAVGKSFGKSFTTVAEVNYFEQDYRFGVGMGSMGGGGIGPRPDIRVGNHKLNFDFGINYIQISDKEIIHDLNVKEHKGTICFQFII